MTCKQKKEAFVSHMLLDEKRNFDIKGRIGAGVGGGGGGGRQREYTNKKEAYSPTSHTEAVFIAADI